MARRRKLKKSVVQKLRLVVCAFFLVLSCILYNNVYKMNIVPSKYLKTILLALIFINLTATFLFLMKGKITKFIGFILYAVLLFICVIGIRYSSITIRFLNKAFKLKGEVVVYDVITLKDAKYDSLLSLKGKKVGYLTLDTNDYMSNITNVVKFDKEAEDLTTLYEKLKDNRIDAAVLSHSYIGLLEEQYPDFADTIKSIHTFDITIINEQTTEEVKELKPITIYITGLDSRSGRIESTGLSDVNMLVTINPKTRTVLLTGIPRDYYVQLHGTTGLKDKLTHSGAYGVNMSKTTVEDVFDLKIDYTVKVGFNSVVNIVDLLGGIEIYSDTGFNSFHYKGWYVKKGNNYMDGKKALAYARERYAYVDGDEHRVRNQQQVFEAIFNKLVSNKSILYKYDTLLDELSDLYSTDIPKSYVTLLIKQQINDMKSWTVISQSVSGTISREQCYSMPGNRLVVMIPDMNSVKTAKSKIEEVLNQ